MSLWDVDDVPTLVGVGIFTLGDGIFFSISVSSLNFFACLIFNSVGSIRMPSKTCTNSAAANIVSLSSEVADILQWVGNSLVVMAMVVPCLLVMKYRPH